MKTYLGMLVLQAALVTLSVGAVSIATPGFGEEEAAPRSEARILDPSETLRSAPVPDGPQAPPGELSETLEPGHAHVRVTRFQEVAPGETTVDLLRQQWGEPIEDLTEDGHQILTYRIGPFPKLEAVVSDGVVQALIVHLASPQAPGDVAEELDLDGLEPVLIHDATGEPLGQAYPERGVVLGFAPDTTPLKVAHLVLEPISAEPFLLRVKHDKQRRYELYLADIDYALSLEPDNAEAFWLKSKVLSDAGRFGDALAAAEKAVALAGDDPRFRLARAVALFQLDRHSEALTDARDVVADERAFELTRARAQCLLGDFLGGGPEQNYNAAAKHYSAAIDLAGPLAADPRAGIRREAKRILIDAHFAMAEAVACGEWSNQHETMQLWLRGGAQLAAATIESDAGHPDLRLHAIHRTLAAYAGLNANSDARPAVQQLVEEVSKLLEDADDPSYQQQVRWQAIEALSYAIEISKQRGADDLTLQYAAHAVGFVEKLNPLAESTPRRDYLLGKLFFNVGLTYALARNDHAAAVRVYEKALPYLSKQLPAAAALERGRHGERFVSMGVSYWQAGVQQEALTLTQRGLELMNAAQLDGLLDEQALIAPLSNLASMYKQLNRPEDAQRMAARAARIQGAEAPSVTR